MPPSTSLRLTSAVPADYHRYERSSDDDVSERENSAEIRPQLSHALSRLHEFPALRSLSIRFGENSPRITNLDRIRDDLSSILDALLSLSATLARRLESLSRLPPSTSSSTTPRHSSPCARTCRSSTSTSPGRKRGRRSSHRPCPRECSPSASPCSKLRWQVASCPSRAPRRVSRT
jgi:hypothetical protein